MQVLERRRESRSSSAAEGPMGSKSAFPYSPPAPKRSRPYGKLLLLALAALVVCVMVFRSQREKRVLGLLVEENERELHSLHALLKKERDDSEDMKKKFEELRENAISLRSQKTELSMKLAEMQNLAANLKERQSDLQLEQEESLRKMKMLKGIESDFAKARNQIKLLKMDLERQREKYEALKNHLGFFSTNQQNMTVDGSRMNLNESLSSNMQEPGEMHFAPEKLLLNETDGLMGFNQQEENKGEHVKIDVSADSYGEMKQLNQVNKSVDEGINLENKPIMLDGEETVVAAGHSTLHSNGGQEPQNSTLIKPEILSDSNSGKMQSSDQNRKHRTSNPIKHKRNRRHGVNSKIGKASSIFFSEQFPKEDGGHSHDRSSLEVDGKKQEINNMTIANSVLELKEVAIPDNGKAMALNHGNETTPADHDSLPRGTSVDASAGNGHSSNHIEDGNTKLFEHGSESIGINSTKLELPSYENGSDILANSSFPAKETGIQASSESRMNAAA